MQSQIILIIDPRKELSQKYKKIIQHSSLINVVISYDLQDADEKIKNLEPDLIIISDNVDVNINDLIKNIREKTVFYRPVITVLSKSSYLNDKLEVLNSGADDFLSEPIDAKEFIARIFAHLRRRIEELSNPITQLPLSKVTYRVLNRFIYSKKNWALMYMDIDNIVPYAEVYGHIAAENIYKAFCAILKSVTDENDFVGHIKEDSFAVITNLQKADRLANLLNTAFDAIAPKFYSQEDAQRGYLILSGDEKAGMRVNFVSNSIGIVTNEFKSFNSYQDAVNRAYDTFKKARIQVGSGYVFDRPRITTDYVDDLEHLIKNILIIEKDAALAYLLSTTLEMQGYKTYSTADIQDAAVILGNNDFDLVIFDIEDEESTYGFDFCKTIKINKNIKLLVSSNKLNKEKVLDTGADLYLPKPYDLITLFNWINKLLSC